MTYSLKHKYEHRVRYADTDKMGIVYNGTYLTYFEIGRTELIRDLGLPYSEVEKHGYHLPLIDANLQFRSPAVYDDLIDIESRCEFDPLSLRIKFLYNITLQGRTICTGLTTHVFIRSENGKPVKPPGFFVQKIYDRYEK